MRNEKKLNQKEIFVFKKLMSLKPNFYLFFLTKVIIFIQKLSFKTFFFKKKNYAFLTHLYHPNIITNYPINISNSKLDRNLSAFPSFSSNFFSVSSFIRNALLTQNYLCLAVSWNALSLLSTSCVKCH